MKEKWVKWANVNRDLKKGEIIRYKLRKPHPKSKDGYIYGRVVCGFGMRKDTIGSAIFVNNEAWTFEECKNKISKDKARWERDIFRIEVIVDLDWITTEFKKTIEEFADKHRITNETLCWFMIEFIDSVYDGHGNIEEILDRVLNIIISEREKIK